MWNKGKTFLLVTGASKGLGRAFAQEMASALSPGSTVFLTARSEDALKETADSLNVNVQWFAVDHGLADASKYADIMSKINPDDYDSAVIVHNAGNIGRQGVTVRNYDNKQDIQDYLDLNYTSPALLNSAFLKRFEKARNVTVINISSLCAIQATQTWANYCSIKAAREMFFKVLAEEEGAKVKVLSYCPGPVDTNLVQTFMADSKVHHGIKDGFDNLYSSGTILQPQQSAKKLVQILNSNAFESGQRLDFYDVE